MAFWFHQLGGTLDEDMVPVIVQLFMLVFAVLCLIAAGACALNNTSRSRPM